VAVETRLAMSSFLTFRPRNAVLALLVLWLVVSAFYYIEYLFYPNFYLGYDEGTVHKVLKYFACLALSICFCLAARAYGLLLFCSLSLLLAAFFAMDRGGLEISILSIMVVGTMMPFILIPSLWKDRMLLIGRVVVLCGAVVGIFSVIEITVLASLFESAWASTASIRSISTLFNPNNLGLYVGVALVLLPYMRLKTMWTALCGALLLFSLAASGSRTAWVSLALVMVYALIVSADARARLAGLLHRHLPQALLTGIMLAGVYAVYLAFSAPPDIEVTHRGVDLYTASIRWQNFLTYIDLIDGGVFFPDVRGERADYIQDNFYLLVLNSFGILGVVLVLAFLVTHFSPRRHKSPDLFPWKLVFVFFMVSGLSGSQLNSFPNNQLFFLSMGAIWFYRPALSLPRTGTSTTATLSV
jgi:hypothetical protein